MIGTAVCTGVIAGAATVVATSVATAKRQMAQQQAQSATLGKKQLVRRRASSRSRKCGNRSSIWLRNFSSWQNCTRWVRRATKNSKRPKQSCCRVGIQFTEAVGVDSGGDG